MYEWLGYIAGFFYIICYFPQIMEIYYKKTNDLSNLFIYFQMIGGVFMLSYGIMNNLSPIIALNGTVLLFLSVILYGLKCYSVRLVSIPSE
ncbi:hypothetical protein [uncultured Mediterranean phage]|nr:hypothetical protein [uncultured Mediterranean phage]